MSLPVERAYRRLGRGTDAWLGPEHLLYFRRQLFSQHAKRFAYGDIQAITLRQTRRYVRWHALLLTLAFACSLPMIAAQVKSASPWAVGILALPSLALLAGSLVHWRRGPTCAFHVRTAVQIEEIRSLRRLRTAREAFHLLRREIARVQQTDGTAPLAETDMPAWYAGPEAAEPARPVLERRAPQRRDYNGWAHALLFISLLLSTVISAVVLIQLDRLVYTLAVINLAMIVGSLVGALVMQHTRHVTNELRVMGWVCTAYLVVSKVVSGSVTPNEFFQFLFFTGEMNVWEHEGFLTNIIITMTIELALSLFGFYFLAQFRGQSRKRPETGGPAMRETYPAHEPLEETGEEEQP